MQTKKELTERIKQLESIIQDHRNERKQMFNKYKFKDELAGSVTNAIQAGDEITDQDSLMAFIAEQIDRECTYYKTCWEIAMELNATEFKEFPEFGEVRSITQLAYAAMDEYIQEELDMDEFQALLDAKNAEGDPV
jgi:hypothetical protein